jgi:hypothetical protein
MEQLFRDISHLPRIWRLQSANALALEYARRAFRVSHLRWAVVAVRCADGYGYAGSFSRTFPRERQKILFRSPCRGGKSQRKKKNEEEEEKKKERTLGHAVRARAGGEFTFQPSQIE